MNSVTIDKIGVIGALTHIAIGFPAAAGAAQVVRESVEFSGLIVVHKKMAIGQVALTIDASAAQNGSIKLNIRSATVLGSSLFGLVRKFAGDMIIKQANSFAWLHAMKAPNGNIWISTPGVNVESVSIGNDITLSWDWK